MFLFFYNFALFVALIVGAPWWLWRMAFTRRYREGLIERLGRVPRRLVSDSDSPLSSGSSIVPASFAAPASSIDRPLIWLHAVSVGEVLAVTGLVRALESALPGYSIVISTTTRTGQALARERFALNHVFYCPLDLPWAVNAYLNALEPRLLILAETEFWPNLLDSCFRREIPVAVVNARISNRSWPRYRRLRWFWRPLLARLSRVLAQSQTDADRLLALGCLPDCVSVAGNLKFDVRAAQESDAARYLRSVSADLRFIVAGSTLEGEESELIDSWPRLLAEDPKLVLVLAPRHPERFSSVGALLQKSGALWNKRSGWPSKASAVLRAPRMLRPGEIVLLDTIGELASVYSLANVAFVGGSLVPAGGHNPLEPAQFAVPIVMGPHYANFVAIVDSLRSHDALRIATKEELGSTLIEILGDRIAAMAMGGRAKEVFDSEAGATDRCVRALVDLLQPIKPLLSATMPIDPGILEEAQRLKHNGAGQEAILQFIRDKGGDKIDSSLILEGICGLSHAQAKQEVHDSEVWRDRKSADDSFHERRWNEFEEASKLPQSEISLTEFEAEIRSQENDEERKP
jgi:3-deoxy-D-manno-octulosonic-acid transferase